MTQTWSIFLLLLMGSPLLFSCDPRSAGSQENTEGAVFRKTIHIDGSSTVYPVTEAVAEAFLAERPKAEIELQAYPTRKDLQHRPGNGAGRHPRLSRVKRHWLMTNPCSEQEVLLTIQNYGTGWLNYGSFWNLQTTHLKVITSTPVQSSGTPLSICSLDLFMNNRAG